MATSSSSHLEPTPAELRPQLKPKFLQSIESLNGTGAVDPKAALQNNETPIFSKRKMQLRIPSSYSGNFIHLAVAKNWLVCLLSSTEQTIFLRFFLPRTIPPGEILMEKYLAGYKITKLFLDPTGHHLLVSLVPKSPGLSADFLYIHGNGPKVRRIEKFKDHEITAVAFNNETGTESSTGPILLGTSRGLIFETELLQDAEKPLYRKQLYDLGLGRPKYPITGLELLRVPNSNKYVVIATAPDCIYTFQDTLKAEEKSLQAIFTSYVNGSKAHGVEKQRTDLHYSLLRFYAPPNEKYPTQWSWLCGAGIRVGQVSAELSSETPLLGESLIRLDFEQRKHLSFDQRRLNVPKAFVMTEYHALLLYSDHVSGISLLNQELVYEEYFNEQVGKLLNIMRDVFSGAIYVYTEKTIFNYKITNEERNVWSIFLAKGLYDLAEVHSAEQPKNLEIVLARRADANFATGKYIEAASTYAETQLAFEEVSLKFMTLEDKKPIITYIRKRLRKLNENNDSKDAIKALVVWLIDLFLTQINMPGSPEKEQLMWQSEFDEFMRDALVKQCTHSNRNMIHNLIAQHADAHNLAQFAISNGDYEEVINQQLNAEKYSEALLTLRQQKNAEHFYKYAPIIIEQLPQETVDALIAQGHKLEIEKLVPTLIATENGTHIDQIIKYLEYVIYSLGTTNQVIHNYLLRLYAKHKPSQLIGYLENQGRDETFIHYDLNFALRICSECDAHVACVFLQCLLHMWSAAVDLALTFDVQLAKETASKPCEEETRRKLWLRIAHYDMQGTNDVKKALSLLKECDLLRIEDLLPFFSDFEKIDDFKEAICDALKDYNQKIQELQHDMQECSKQATRVRDDLQNVRLRSVRIDAHEYCTICESFLLVKPFFAFSCGHKFHSDCLEKYIIPMLSSECSRRLTMLKQQLENLMTQSIAMAEHSREHQKRRAQIKLQIEEILASDCLYCGFMIETIDQPFVADWDQVNVDWE